MTDRPWLSSYPQGVPADIDASQYHRWSQLMEESFKKYADRTAYSFMGKDISYGETDSQSRPSPPTCRAWAWPRATAWRS
jgi:long-chain acyl-CoA synthetase